MKHVKNIMIMKISKIKKKNNSYIIELSDNTSLNFSEETIIKYNLLKPRNIEKEKLQEIIEYEKYSKCLKIALNYITYKERCPKEIEDKLNGYDKDIIDKVIKKLKELGFLNEDKYIKLYIHDQINLGNKGIFLIKKELLKLKLNEEKIDAYLEEINEDIWKEKIEKIVNKKISGNHKYGNKYLKQKLKQDLIKMGYPIELVTKVLEKIDFKEENENLEKEYAKEYKKLSKKYEGKELEYKIRINLYKKGFSIEDIDY